MSELLEVNVNRYAAAVELVKSMKSPSVCSLQRKFKIGYGTAMNLVDVMVQRGDWPTEVIRGRKGRVSQPA